MIRSSLIASLVVAVCMSVSTPVVYAEPAPHKTPSQKDLDAARKHFQGAEAAKARGEYQTAAVEYLAAYELFEEPAFFYDTAEVYRLAGDEKDSLVYYTKYLELAPGGQGAPAARTAIDQLRRSIAAKEDEARRKADDDARRKADQAARHDGEPRAKPVDDVDEATPTRTGRIVHTTPNAGRGMRLAGLAAGGVGVVALGIGVIYGLKARSLSADAADWEKFDQQRNDEGKADERNMFVLTGVGAAALVAGGVLYYLGHRAEQSTDTAAVAVMPSIGPAQVSLMATGRF
jgi:tetratricopeptide (TPR) repeat protein